MRKLTLITLILTGLIYGQNVKVLETEVLVEKENNTEYAFPTFSPNGNQVLYTTANYSGLWIYDNTSKITKNLNNLRGAGYQPVFSNNGEKIFFRHDTFVKRRKYSSIAHQSINNLKIQNIIENERSISTPISQNQDMIIYKKDGEKLTYTCKENNQIILSKNTITADVNAFTENSNLYIEKNGIKTILNPVGEGHYIWGSISPKKDKILFTVAGRGTYITDLAGNIENTYLSANYPNWSPDGRWIVFMSDTDDGHIVTSSEINVIHIATNKKFPLTNTKNKLEMYPTWSPKGNEIVYHTTTGNIELLKLEIQE